MVTLHARATHDIHRYIRQTYSYRLYNSMCATERSRGDDDILAVDLQTLRVIDAARIVTERREEILAKL